MIQGCWYLRRSTDRWTLSKNSMTRLKDSRLWRKASLLWECFSITITYIQGSYLYPVVVWLLVDYTHNIWYLIYRPSGNAYPSIRPFRSGHVTTQSCEISANSPIAERKQTADRKFLCRILLKKPSFSRRDFLPSWAHESDSLLYQILVSTLASI
jgi:hypothetical protein